MADLAPVCFCVSTKFKAWEPWLSLPQESFVNFAFWPRYYSLVGPELCEFAIALLNFSPKTVTNDRWQNVQRVLNETKTCHICRIDLFQACVKKMWVILSQKCWHTGLVADFSNYALWHNESIAPSESLRPGLRRPQTGAPAFWSHLPATLPKLHFAFSFAFIVLVFAFLSYYDISENKMSWLSGGLTFTDIPGHSNANFSFKMPSPS